MYKSHRFIHLAFFTALALLSLPGCRSKPKPLVLTTIINHPVESSIRSLEVVDDSTIWFAGSKGIFGVTHNGGRTWTIDSLNTDSSRLEFRSIAVTNRGTFILNVGSPALLYRTTDEGNSWELVYREDHPKAFYDAMAFWDDNEGIAMGDPTDSCLSILITRDGGDHWTKLSCGTLPPTEEGEAAFAASNSNIALVGDHAWIVTGGKRSRVFHSPDRGNNWEVFDTPIVQGEQMTGIYACDFIDESTGIIIGGNWEKKEMNTANKAITHDGGKSWLLVSDSTGPGYRSGVRFVPNSNGRHVLAVGDTGLSYSTDAGNTWTELSTENFYTIRISPSGKSVWVAGNKRVSQLLFK